MNEPTRDSSRRIYLIDASIYIFRAWYIYPETITDSKNRPINALYGFLYFLSDFLDKSKPDYVAIAFDANSKKDFRRLLYPPYKANRNPAPAALKYQFTLCYEIACSLGIPCFRNESFEADDLIASLAKNHQQQGFAVTVVSADKDLAQIIKSEQDYLWDFARDQRYTKNGVFKKFGVMPDKMAYLLALMGDKVDNIPGIDGVGLKTAANILNYYSSWEELLTYPEKLSQAKIRGARKLAQLISDSRQELQLYYQLTLLEQNADLGGSIDCRCAFPSANEVESLLISYNADRILCSRFLRVVFRQAQAQ